MSIYTNLSEWPPTEAIQWFWREKRLVAEPADS